ncbi:MAG: SufD family Fe-S cluster assembly protein [Actinomycetota bacterium]
MNEHFSSDIATSLGGGRDRLEAAQLASAAELPSAETEDWRYSPIADLPIGDLRPVVAAPDGVAVDDFGTVVTARAATVTIIDGFVTSVEVDAGWAAKGLSIDGSVSIESSIPANERTLFDHLHAAFSPTSVRISVPAGLAVTDPIVVINHHATAGSVAFPHLIVDGGPSCEVSVVERQTSVAATALIVPVTELTAADAANVRYSVIQENEDGHWQVGRQWSSVGSQATLSAGTAAFGGQYQRVRSDCRIVGRGGTANLVAAYYGDGDQVLDFRTFQHHEARDTRSDLLFKGSQDDTSGSIYTGLIHIHPDGAGSNAFQTNRNVKLSEDAWAWSVPNLEIENNDVHCSHASTVSPVDTDQRFYLHAPGGRRPADRRRLL